MSISQMLKVVIILGVLAVNRSEAHEIPCAPGQDSLNSKESKISVYKLTAAGIALGVAGLFVGGGVALGTCDNYYHGDPEADDDLTCLGVAILGAGAGEAVGMSIGVHAANDRRGHLGCDILISTGYAIGLLAMLNRRGIGPFVFDQDGLTRATVVGVAGQLASVIAAERSLGRYLKKRGGVVSLGPSQIGGRGLFALISFPVGI